jgi:hypothetical protein
MFGEFDLAAWVTKNLAIVIVVVASLLGVGGLLWWNHHVELKNAAAVPKAEATINKAEATAGGQAVQTVTTNAKKADQTDAKVQQITNNFNTYPAAKAAVDPGLFDAFSRGVCMFHSASGLSECKRLQQPDP